MKLPKIFIPEKNLENETENLLQEKKNTSNHKPIKIEQKELEELLNSFDEYSIKGVISDVLHEKIDGLIRKSDYQCLKAKNLEWEYWSRPAIQNFDESYVLVRSSDKYGWKHYAFARVDNAKLENFCRLFEKYETGVLSGINYNKPYFQIGMVTGTLGGAIPLVMNPALMSTLALAIPIVGFFGGMLGGTKLAHYAHMSYGKKLVRHYEELETFSLHAIKKAFENENP